MYLNEFDVEQAAQRFADHPVLGPATQTLTNLVRWTNSNSDGWPYWAPPGRASQKLQALVSEATTAYYRGTEPTATVEQYKLALRPLKAFRTKLLKATAADERLYGSSSWTGFEIVEAKKVGG